MQAQNTQTQRQIVESFYAEDAEFIRLHGMVNGLTLVGECK